ncbi:hypothetical protein L873DRAFT_1807222 [Choiromyces venosus 120613-1]|uniref:Uncharacterized protein n=1 Tax=Choiromyces venosus 120613-1 TaxID=1336337 RepID=A0A3N4JLB3_9PEZI|nr:hypothetical protein L873DRAFT_1807222 [Choiromyces venosus 120613-1]
MPDLTCKGNSNVLARGPIIRVLTVPRSPKPHDNSTPYLYHTSTSLPFQSHSVQLNASIVAQNRILLHSTSVKPHAQEKALPSS